MMSAQLDRLIEAVALRWISPAPCPASYIVEGLAGLFYLKRAQDLELYQRVFKTLRRIALSDEDSVTLIAEIMRKLNGGA